MNIAIRGGVVLREGVLAAADLLAGPEGLAELPERNSGESRDFDASGLMVLPGIVDVHGDAFERQIMPRPGVSFPLDMALAETDRQLVSNGITTACHGITVSWEPGLRSLAQARALIASIERLRPTLMADTLIHLRYETATLDAEHEVKEWLAAGRVAVLAFNDHMESVVKSRGERKAKLAKMVERSGVSEEAFIAIVDAVDARMAEVPASVARLAAAGQAAGIALMSHDDRSPAERAAYRALGCAIAEFPTTEDTAFAARAAGEPTVFGAPNVIRGGSHTGFPNAAEMVAKGLCSVLASDYYYPALAAAPAKLAADGRASFEAAWALVSENPARALGLADRGVIAPGRRADLVLARREGAAFSLVATIARGRLVHCLEPERLGRRAARQAERSAA